LVWYLFISPWNSQISCIFASKILQIVFQLILAKTTFVGRKVYWLNVLQQHISIFGPTVKACLCVQVCCIVQD
jgi:hypothetical protein